MNNSNLPQLKIGDVVFATTKIRRMDGRAQLLKGDRAEVRGVSYSATAVVVDVVLWATSNNGRIIGDIVLWGDKDNPLSVVNPNKDKSMQLPLIRGLQ